MDIRDILDGRVINRQRLPVMRQLYCTVHVHYPATNMVEIVQVLWHLGLRMRMSRAEVLGIPLMYLSRD